MKPSDPIDLGIVLKMKGTPGGATYSRHVGQATHAVATLPGNFTGQDAPPSAWRLMEIGPCSGLLLFVDAVFSSMSSIDLAVLIALDGDDTYDPAMIRLARLDGTTVSSTLVNLVAGDFAVLGLAAGTGTVGLATTSTLGSGVAWLAVRGNGSVGATDEVIVVGKAIR